MKTQHTPEPWFLVERNATLEICSFDQSEEFPKQVIATVNDCDKNPLEDHTISVKANAQRIVACVNACEGLANPEAVKDMREALQRLVKAIEYVKAERDFSEEIEQSRAALAKATGESQ